MLIYLSILMLVVLASYLAESARSGIARRVLLGIAFVTLVLGAGLRDRLVGTDTTTYLEFFDHIRTFDAAVKMGVETQEYGFWMLTWLLHFMSDQYAILLMAIALIVIGCYHYAIVAYSRQISVSYFVFIANGVYTFFFNGARQGIAIAVYALAIGPMLNRRFPRYVALVLLASLFHKSALAMIPLYWIFNRPNNLKTNMLIVSLGIFTSIFLERIVGMASGFDARYAGYASQGEGGGYYSLGLALALALFFSLFRKQVLLHRNEYDRYFNMLLFSVMIAVVSGVAAVDPSGFMRIAEYSSMAQVLLWPLVFENLPQRLSRFIVYYVFVVGFLALFVISTERFSNLVPYRLNSLFQF